MLIILIEKCVIKPVTKPWIEWVASYDGVSDTGDEGLGETKAEAVVDLFERFPEPQVPQSPVQIADPSVYQFSIFINKP